MLQRGEVTNPFDAFDQAATRIGEKYAQRPRMRGGGEEVYPPGGEGAGSRAEKAIVAPRADTQGARPARKPARQEVSAEDLEFHQYEFASEATRFTFSAVASPLLPQKSHELETFRQPGINVCNFGRFWSGRRDSNPRPRPWQGGARLRIISDEPAMCVLNARQTCLDKKPKNPFGIGTSQSTSQLNMPPWHQPTVALLIVKSMT